MKPNIVFLSNLPCFWDSIRTIYENFHKDETFNVYIISQNYSFFTRKNIFAIDNQNGKFDLNRVNPSIIFRDIPYCEQLPSNYRIASLVNLRNMPKICFVPYGCSILPLTSMGTFVHNHPYHNYCWKIFVSTERVKKMYCDSSQNDIGKEKFIVSGIPKLDVYLENKNGVSDPIWRLNKKKILDAKRIIWTSHSTISHAIYDDNTKQNNYSKGFSTFLKYKDYFLELAKKYPKLDIVLRPHPSLFYHLVTRKHMTTNELKDYISEFCSFKNTSIFPTLTRDYFDLFLSSDALISDYSATLTEYLPTKKPILYLQRDDAPELGTWFNNAKYNYKARTESDIENFIESVVIKAHDPLYEERVKVLKEYFHTPKGGAGNFIKEYITEELDKEISKIRLSDTSKPIQDNTMQILTLKRILQNIGVNSIVDIGCGYNSPFYSKHFGSYIYSGIDINAELIMEKRNWFSPYKNMKFDIMDITVNKLPQADLIFCKNVLPFLTNHQIWKLLHNIINSKSKYLMVDKLVTTYNIEGTIDLCREPFCLPQPLWIHAYTDDINIMCWNVEALSFYIPNLAIGSPALLLYKRSIIEKTLNLLEEMRVAFRYDLFIKIIQGFFYDCETQNKLLNSDEIKDFITDDVHKILAAFFYIIYGEQLTQEITSVLSEVENSNFEITKHILKDILFKYAQGGSVS